MFDLSAYLHEKREWINLGLEHLLSDGTYAGRLADAMRYAVTAGGKRIRPILCVASAEAVGGAHEAAVLNTACALELIHTYSLIHDDLPAMDDDALRRGKPTCHIAFDGATAILAGDALLTLAFQVLSAVKEPGGMSAETGLGIIRSLAEAVGPKGMVEGQMRDVISEGNLLSLEELGAIHRLKTGALISASVTAGAALANAHPSQLEHLKTYAENIGMAFQVVDDILNVEGDKVVMGKAVGTDQARSKNTYPSLIGIAASKDLAKKLVDNGLQALSIFDGRSEPLRAIALYIIERKK
ncbi:MAG: farnesyl diphosphate synthase [Pseudomonadota bacterium]